MPLIVFEGWSLNFFQKLEHYHFLSDFVETFRVKHTFLNTLKNIFSSEYIRDCSFVCDGLKLNVSVHDKRAVAKDIHDEGVLRRVDLSDFFEKGEIIVMFFDENVDGAAVNDDHGALSFW